MTSLKGKIALVTGSTSGIGKGIASHFLSLGASVIVHGPDLAGAQSIAEAMRSGGHDVDAVAGDLRNVDACRQIVRDVVQRRGGLDILVNNAATVARASVEDATVDQWDTIMAVNLRAPFLLLQEAVKSMKTRGGGSIVNIGSINAYVGLPQLGPYSVSKGGLMTMTKNAALALGRHHIRVNQLNVGWTLTEGEDAVQRSDGKGPDWLKDAVKMRPFGRLLLPADIAAAAAYFASDDSAVVSGAVIDVEQFPLGGLEPW
ncbi:MAG TPA: oxidoreductase [Vicinamibacterales bacterium]|nr:oxidoreductase [Vicinamibacterales bacterium]